VKKKKKQPMRHKKKIAAIAIAAALTGAEYQYCLVNKAEGMLQGRPAECVPCNHEKYPVGFAASGVPDEGTFNRVIDRTIPAYAQHMRDKFGCSLVVNRAWFDGTVNAYAQRQGNTCFVNMYGGLARHPKTTEWGFQGVLCHEIGHHAGGAPRYPNDGGWASNEGQSDYYAILKCFERVFDKDTQPLSNAEAGVNEFCLARHKNQRDFAICQRARSAGLSMGRLMGALGGTGDPNPAGRDSRVVSQTYDSHPGAQCRADTYLAGASCRKDWQIDPDRNDPERGSVCSLVQGDVEGRRPLCWYAPPAVSPPPPPPPPPPPVDDGPGCVQPLPK